MTDPSQPGVPGGQPWSSDAPPSPFTSAGAPNWPPSPYWTPPASASPSGTPYPPTGAPNWPPAPPAVGSTAPASGRGLRVVGWVLVIVSFVGGVLVFGFGTYRAVRSATDLQRVPAAVGGSVTIRGPGVYMIYYEPGALARSGRDASDPVVQAVGPDGMVATVTPPDRELSYSFGDRAGHKIAQLTADRPGRYQIETQSADTPSGELAVGEDPGGWFTWAFIGAGVAIVIFLVGLVLLIVDYVQRRPRY
ncbi:MAG: hypothetical protein J2P20_10030 [Pseudonocardia sp.]|nr:hypothetical protein [Pseudonocardia sp.]